MQYSQRVVKKKKWIWMEWALEQIKDDSRKLSPRGKSKSEVDQPLLDQDYEWVNYLTAIRKLNPSGRK